MIVYVKTNGQAHDLRFEAPDYALKENEHKHSDDDYLPDIMTLHDLSFLEVEVSAKFNKMVKETLQEIDLKSIRTIREWLANQPGAPQFILDYENQAVTERAKLKK